MAKKFFIEAKRMTAGEPENYSTERTSARRVKAIHKDLVADPKMSEVKVYVMEEITIDKVGK